MKRIDGFIKSAAILLIWVMTADQALANEMNTYYNGLLGRNDGGPYVNSRNDSTGHVQIIIAFIDTDGMVTEFGIYNDLGAEILQSIEYDTLQEFEELWDLTSSDAVFGTVPGGICSFFIVCEPYQDLGMVE